MLLGVLTTPTTTTTAHSGSSRGRRTFGSLGVCDGLVGIRSLLGLLRLEISLLLCLLCLEIRLRSLCVCSCLLPERI